MTAMINQNGEMNNDVKILVEKMIDYGVTQIFPTEDNDFYNENIKELIVDEEGTVFILFKDTQEPVMIPEYISIQ